MLIFWIVGVIAFSATTIVVLGLASIIFLSAILLGVALMLRSRWDKIASSDPPNRER